MRGAAVGGSLRRYYEDITGSSTDDVVFALDGRKKE
jgi:hypothetical protein